MDMEKYEDPEHELNSPTYHTGELCKIRGCDLPAGTAWSTNWCWKHNAERMNRISKRERLFQQKECE